MKPTAQLTTNPLAARRRLSLLRLQFRLKSLFVVIALNAVALSLIVVPAERQRRAVAAIRAAGGRV